MAQVLLRNNRRASIALTILAALPSLAGLFLLMTSQPGPGTLRLIIAIFAWCLLLGGTFLLAKQIWWTCLPRICYEPDELLVYLKNVKAIRVPLDAVECFFLGEGPSMIPLSLQQDVNSVTVVVRLAERATEWHQRSVNQSLGKWADGYIIVRGTWTEPLNREVVTQMNSNLAAIKRARKTTKA
ncbi:MAG: hypothetical protein P8N76_12165 [Pirellulaceae bacterium]|nr:hypothetical protein [Pirellulaceae bacterium]